jgi:PKD repeat protein
MLSSDGDAFFKKKLFHHGGYSDSTAQRQGVVDNLQDRWIGIKFVVYNLDDGNVKLELWVDDGDETNNWRKATEYVDEGSWEVAGSDCGRDGDETIDEGTRGAFRVDDSVFEFKKLSIREIVGSGEVADGALLEEGATAEEEEEGATAEEEAETGNLPTVEIISNGMEGVAPATFEFGAHITGGTESYTISWDFGDGSEVSDEENVAHTFEEPSRYNVAVTITDSNGETASDNLDVTVEEAAIEEREGGQETE